ncbi:putative N6-adenine-specific DNA methylase [Fibrobacter sp. UWB15]|uniref:THUMP domain-containing class I SAM-dependent RNA methyltransferase n=1 Tax=unclassified Fibrobacter TaxID=2634177 RepID=UPI000919F535|nr:MULTISPECIES: RNA methyltransferase [unclassified Fibrobacter]PWJ67766.1 putative N6-adenine-specific DNA methylase [Fibrobacter sp. UWB6]SHF77450.1 putative N6-adenine-specific DNA methylase [Fibrobacter sp. UWB8]SMG14923.1 putative N6-adenine-specific DNA methylase [Fibrobacter sp. UWB15]
MKENLEKRLKRQIIGKPHRFLAIAPLGFEATLAYELSLFGLEFLDDECAPHVTGDGKVEFSAKITEAWKAVAYSRVANRVLIHLADFKAENFRELEKKAAEIPWELFLDEKRINIHVSCKHSRLYHSDAIAERLQNVIEEVLPLDHLLRSGSHHLYVNFLDDRCTIWLDLAGEELYKRGHERFVNDAPLKETIAAAMILEATQCLPSESFCLLDLMAGSGTFSLEAAYMANSLIPGKCRDFALKHQPAFKEATWNFIIKSKQERRNVFKIITSDILPKAVEIIQHNVASTPLASIDQVPVTPQVKDFFCYTAHEIAEACPDETVPIIVLNPPYGKRLDFDAPKLYTRIGRRLAELARALKQLGKPLTVAILAPKDDSRPGTHYTCTANLLHECPDLSPSRNVKAKCIATSHGGFSLNTFIASL